MQLLHNIKQRLANRSDSEHEQALLRIAIVGLFLAYMAGFHGWPSEWSPHDLRVVVILATFLLIATAIFVVSYVLGQWVKRAINPSPAVER